MVRFSIELRLCLKPSLALPVHALGANETHRGAKSHLTMIALPFNKQEQN